LDVGSGIGRMALPLTRYLSERGTYDGIEIVPSGVKWCRKAITPRHPNFRFHEIDVYNLEYNPKGRLKADEYRFPFPDASFDFMFLTSIFTHMLPRDIENYVGELGRVAAPGARCFITLFLLNEESRSAIRKGGLALHFDHEGPGGLKLYVRDVDLLDGTPILDIKPYVAYTDAFPESGSGWLAAADPRPTWEVGFSPLAATQVAWITARSALPLRERIAASLGLGPQPHPYRRIRRSKDGRLQLAVQDWRVDFRVEGQTVEVLALRSGYRQSQLESAGSGPDDPLQVHREFAAAFSRDAS
jgi:SAM-dependent methyltransferase